MRACGCLSCVARNTFHPSAAQCPPLEAELQFRAPVGRLPDRLLSRRNCPSTRGRPVPGEEQVEKQVETALSPFLRVPTDALRLINDTEEDNLDHKGHVSENRLGRNHEEVSLGPHSLACRGQLRAPGSELRAWAAKRPAAHRLCLPVIWAPLERRRVAGHPPHPTPTHPRHHAHHPP